MFEAVRELAKVIRPGTVVVTKSTVPVGTGDEIERILREEGVTDVSVASNPEFLREGAAIADFKHPDRIVVGANDQRAEAVLKEIYRPLFLNRAPILFTARRTAELTKYAANAFLAVKISFINEIADLCEAVDADVQDVARGIGLDNRIGAKFLHAGPGYGGSCFPKDTLALLQTADKFGVDQRIVRTTVEVNDDRKASMPLARLVSGSFVRTSFALFSPSARTWSAWLSRFCSCASVLALSAASSRLSATLSAFASILSAACSRGLLLQALTAARPAATVRAVIKRMNWSPVIAGGWASPERL